MDHWWVIIISQRFSNGLSVYDATQLHFLNNLHLRPVHRLLSRTPAGVFWLHAASPAHCLSVRNLSGKWPFGLFCRPRAHLRDSYPY